MAQWLRICLPTQGTWVRALVREDPTCRGATKPVCHNYWAHVPQLLKPTRLEPVLHNKRSHHNEKPSHCNEDPMQPKINKFIKKKTKNKKLEYGEELFTVILSVLRPCAGLCTQEHPRPMTDKNWINIPAPLPLWWYNAETHGLNCPPVELSFICFVTPPLFISFLSLSHFATLLLPSHTPGVFWDNLPNKLTLKPLPQNQLLGEPKPRHWQRQTSYE